MIINIIACLIGFQVGIWITYLQIPNIGKLFLHPSNIGMFFLPFLFYIKKYNQFLFFIWHFIIGTILSGIFFICVRQTENKINFLTLVSIGLLLVLFYLMLMIISMKILNNHKISLLTFTNKEICIILLTIILTIIIFRLSYYALYDIPNDKRSLMINNIEIHHINIGVILLMIVSLFESSILQFSRKFYIIFTSFIIGIIADQSFYILLNKTPDKAYGGLFSTLGVFFMPCMIIVIIKLIQNRIDKQS